MRIPLLLAPLLAVAAIGLAAAAPAYDPPAETPALKPGENMELTLGNCLGCHSVDYITTQPPGMAPTFWQAEVTKMINVYGAPVAPEDAAKIVAYLNQAYRTPD